MSAAMAFDEGAFDTVIDDMLASYPACGVSSPPPETPGAGVDESASESASLPSDLFGLEDGVAATGGPTFGSLDCTTWLFSNASEYSAVLLTHEPSKWVLPEAMDDSRAPDLAELLSGDEPLSPPLTMSPVSDGPSDPSDVLALLSSSASDHQADSESHSESLDSDSLDRRQAKRRHTSHSDTNDDGNDDDYEPSYREHPCRTVGDFLAALNEEERDGVLQEAGDTLPAVDTTLDGALLNELRKLRRRVRNKISAQASRKRRKEYVADLERNVQSLQQVNKDLKQEVTRLERERVRTEKELAKLKALTAPLRPAASASSRRAVSSSANAKACLMVLLLSLGVFFSPSTERSGGSAPITAARDYAGAKAGGAGDTGYLTRTLKSAPTSGPNTCAPMTLAPPLPKGERPLATDEQMDALAAAVRAHLGEDGFERLRLRLVSELSATLGTSSDVRSTDQENENAMPAGPDDPANSTAGEGVAGVASAAPALGLPRLELNAVQGHSRVALPYA